jgi:Tol biopolymer transport system component
MNGMRIRRRLQALGFCAVVAVAACGAPDQAAAPQGVFVDPEPGEVHLQNIQKLTFGGNNAEGYFSRSGEQIIFQRQEQVSDGCDQQYIINVDGTGLRRVSNGQGRTTCGYFYDDDRRILYSSTFEHSPACPAPPDHSQGYVWPIGHFEIYTSAPDGSDPQKLTDNGTYNAEATLSPDGSRIVFTSTMDGDLEIYTMNVDGSDLVRVTNRVGYDGGAFFSPDGSMIVWRAGYPETATDSADYLGLLEQRMVRPGNLEIRVANIDGSDARQVTDLGGANFAPFFHPDGQRIIFASNHESEGGRAFNLYIIGMDGMGLERVTYHGEFDSFPMFSPDGSKLVWASNRHGEEARETNLFIADWID